MGGKGKKGRGGKKKAPGRKPQPDKQPAQAGPAPNAAPGPAPTSSSPKQRPALKAPAKCNQTQFEVMIAPLPAEENTPERYEALLNMAKEIPTTSIPELIDIAARHDDTQAIKALLAAHSHFDFNECTPLTLANIARPDYWPPEIAERKMTTLCLALLAHTRKHPNSQAALDSLNLKAGDDNAFQITLRNGHIGFIEIFHNLILYYDTARELLADMDLAFVTTRACELGIVDVALDCLTYNQHNIDLEKLPLQAGTHSPLALYALSSQTLQAATLKKHLDAHFDAEKDYSNSTLLQLYACACRYKLDDLMTAISKKCDHATLATQMQQVPTCAKVNDAIILYEYSTPDTTPILKNIPGIKIQRVLNIDTSIAALKALVAHNKTPFLTLILFTYYIEQTKKMLQSISVITRIEKQWLQTSTRIFIYLCNTAPEDILSEMSAELATNIFSMLLYSDNPNAAAAAKRLIIHSKHLNDATLAKLPETDITKPLSLAGRNCLTAAMDAHHYPFAIILLSEFPALADNCEQDRLLLTITDSEHLSLFEEWRRRNPDMDIPTILARTVLQSIADLDNPEVRKRLLKVIPTQKALATLYLPTIKSSGFRTEQLSVIAATLRALGEADAAKQFEYAAYDAKLPMAPPAAALASLELYEITRRLYHMEGDPPKLRDAFRAQVYTLEAAHNPETIKETLYAQLRDYKIEDFGNDSEWINGFGLLCADNPELAEWILHRYPALINDTKPQDLKGLRCSTPLSMACNQGLSHRSLAEAILSTAYENNITLTINTKTGDISPMYLAHYYHVELTTTMAEKAAADSLNLDPKQLTDTCLLHLFFLSVKMLSLYHKTKTQASKITKRFKAEITRRFPEDKGLTAACETGDTKIIDLILDELYDKKCPVSEKRAVFAAALSNPGMGILLVMGFTPKEIQDFSCNQQPVPAMQFCIDRMTYFNSRKNTIRAEQYIKFAHELIKMEVPINTVQLIELFQNMTQYSNNTHPDSKAACDKLLDAVTTTIIRKNLHTKLGLMRGMPMIRQFFDRIHQQTKNAEVQENLVFAARLLDQLTFDEQFSLQTLEALIRRNVSSLTNTEARAFIHAVKEKFHADDLTVESAEGQRLFALSCNNDGTANTLSTLAFVELGFALPADVFSIEKLSSFIFYKPVSPTITPILTETLLQRMRTHPDEVNGAPDSTSTPLAVFIKYRAEGLLDKLLDQPGLTPVDGNITETLDFACNHHISPRLVVKMAAKWGIPDDLSIGTKEGGGSSPMWFIAQAHPEKDFSKRLHTVQKQSCIAYYSHTSFAQIIALMRQYLNRGKLPTQVVKDFKTYTTNTPNSLGDRGINYVSIAADLDDPALVCALALNRADFESRLLGRHIRPFLEIAIQHTDTNLLEALLNYIKVTGIDFDFHQTGALLTLCNAILIEKDIHKKTLQAACFATLIKVMNEFTDRERAAIQNVVELWCQEKSFSLLQDCAIPSLQFVFKAISTKEFIEHAAKGGAFQLAALCANILVAQTSKLAVIKLLEQQDGADRAGMLAATQDFPVIKEILSTIADQDLLGKGLYSKEIEKHVKKIRKETHANIEKTTKLHRQYQDTDKSTATVEALKAQKGSAEEVYKKLKQIDFDDEFLDPEFKEEHFQKANKAKEILTTLKADLQQAIDDAEKREQDKSEIARGKQQEAEQRKAEADKKAAERERKAAEQKARQEAERIEEERQRQEQARQEAALEKQKVTVKRDYTDRWKEIEKELKTLQTNIAAMETLEHYKTYQSKIAEHTSALRTLFQYKPDGKWHADVKAAMKEGRSKVPELQNLLNKIRQQLKEKHNAITQREAAARREEQERVKREQLKAAANQSPKTEGKGKPKPRAQPTKGTREAPKGKFKAEAEDTAAAELEAKLKAAQAEAEQKDAADKAAAEKADLEARLRAAQAEIAKLRAQQNAAAADTTTTTWEPSPGAAVFTPKPKKTTYPVYLQPSRDNPLLFEFTSVEPYIIKLNLDEKILRLQDFKFRTTNGHALTDGEHQLLLASEIQIDGESVALVSEERFFITFTIMDESGAIKSEIALMTQLAAEATAAPAPGASS